MNRTHEKKGKGIVTGEQNGKNENIKWELLR